MTTYAALATPDLAVVPGTEVTYTATVRNRGETVESYSCAVVGEVAGWAWVRPAEFQLYPGAEATVAVTFRPPKSPDLPTGEIPFALQVVPTGNPVASCAPEGTLLILPYQEVTGEIRPRTSRTRRRVRHQIALDNRGNTTLEASLRPTDLDEGLAVRIRPARLRIPPGQAGFATLKVRHRRRLWLGEPASRPVQVVVKPAEGPLTLLDATCVQSPTISRTAARVLSLGLVGVLLLAAAWVLLLRKPLPSTVTGTSLPVSALSAGTSRSPSDGTSPENGASVSPAQSGPSLTASPSPRPSNSLTPVPSAQGFTQYLAIYAYQSQSEQKPKPEIFTVPAGQVFSLSLVGISNSQGDVGQIEIVHDQIPIGVYALADFAEKQMRLPTVLELGPNEELIITVTCVQPGRKNGLENSRCYELVTLTGALRAATPA